MRRTIATVSISGTLEEKLSAISAAKFDGIELFDNDLVASALSPTQVSARCADLGLSIELFQPIRDLEGLSPAGFADARRRLERKLDIMEQLGVTMALVCANATPGAIDDLDLSAEQMHAMGDVAGERGIRLAFEALAWGTHINRVTQAWEVVRRADHPAVGLTVDTFHLLARGDDASALDGIPGESIDFLQIADAPHLLTDTLEWSRHHRCFPGQGTFDLASVVGTVVEKGYRGPLSLEVFSDVVREADPHATALDAMRSLLFLEEQLRRRWDGAAPAASSASSADVPGGVPERPRVTLLDPPPPPSDVRVGFVEIAVRQDADLAPLLGGLGFERVGGHRTKAASWWRNGTANVVLNSSSDLEDRWAAAVSRPAATGLGLEVDDVGALSDRAGALLWPLLRLRRGQGEAPMLGTDTPAGLHVFTAGRAGTSDDWRQDFLAEPSAVADGGVAAEGSLTGVDHVGYPIAFDVSDAEISFYRTLLDLPAGAISEFADTRGRVRSRVVRAVDGAGRPGAAQIVLNVTAGRVGGPHRGLNQIAFACPDVVAVVRAARAAGVGILAVPANYYDDLAARFDLDPRLVEELRRHDVLYDRSGEGEFLHAYTRTIGGEFYIELVQRADGYTGFGAANAFVRLLAQAAQPVDGRPAPA